MAPEQGQSRAAPLSEARRTGGAAGLAAGRYRRALRAALGPVRSAEAEARRLHAVEREGEAGGTPFIAVLGLILFFLPVFLVMVGLAFAAYYLAY